MPGRQLLSKREAFFLLSPNVFLTFLKIVLVIIMVHMQ